MAALPLAMLLGMDFLAAATETRAADSPTMIELPHPTLKSEVSVEQALAERRSVREFRDAPLNLAQVGQLLWSAQGITHDEGMRTAPSAGALYPLEVYVAVGAVGELPVGVYHYHPNQHALSRIIETDARTELARVAYGQSWIATAPAIIVIAAVYERTARKYGTRAERYVLIEVGHAAQNVYLQAVALKLGTTIVGAFDDRRLKNVLELKKNERPLCILPVGYP